jgi:DNA polymerase III subunit beta
MKFTILKENLKQGLLAVTNLTSKNINLPILNNVLIKTKKEGVELSATNLEISINHFLRGKTEKEGSFTINSRILNEYIGLLPDEKIEVELVEEEVEIRCGKYKTKIKGDSPSDFPILPVVESDVVYSFDALELKEALASVMFAASVNDNRAELSGVFFSFNDKELTLAATDSYRLAEKKIKIKEGKAEGKELGGVSTIVPIKTIQEVVRILNNIKTESDLDSDMSVDICITENQILFQINKIKIISRVIIGSYPDYKQIIPKKEKTLIETNKDSLVRAIKSAGIFSKTGINDVGLSFEKNQVIVSSSSSQTGENVIELDANIKGENNDILINYKYILEGLNNIKSDTIIIKVVDSNTPCVLSSKQDDQFFYIVMPIKQ